MSDEKGKPMVTRGFAKLGNNPLAREGAPLLGLYWLYSSIRWLIARNSPYEAFQNAFKIIHLEQQLGIFFESTIQRWLIDHAMGVVYIANEFYTLGYFPILILCGVLLYRFEPERFLIFKLTFLLGLGFALICFSAFPLAPPRMLPEVGFVDTQQAFGSSLYNHKSVLSFYNPYAAMPSLHFGWALLVGIMAYSFERRILKIFGILYPSFMALVIVTTGHHYFLDIAGGGLFVGLAYMLVRVSPYVFHELSSSPARINGGATLEERPARLGSSRRSDGHNIPSWSKEQRDYVRQQKLRSTITAMLNSWRPPV
jgi:membrane-associated phospholipid phosphatase